MEAAQPYISGTQSYSRKDRVSAREMWSNKGFVFQGADEAIQCPRGTTRDEGEGRENMEWLCLDPTVSPGLWEVTSADYR